MIQLYPEIEPYDNGMLDVDDGNAVYWETCGNPQGKTAVVLHGGPGSGSSPWFRRLFDPGAYRIALFDQRNCGRSIPHASDPQTDLASNTTAHLVADIERLREYLGIDRWLVLGGSWGSTLALAYAVTHPEQVSELVLFGVTTGRHAEFDWTFRGGLARFFPEQWERLWASVPSSERDGDIVDVYHRLLNDLDPRVRRTAANAWCLWESATPSWPPTAGLAKRFEDPDYALAFARIVTHYVRNNAWLEDGVLLRDASRLAATPGVLINGRFDFQAPIANAWELKRAWPRADLIIVDDAGHSPIDAVAGELIQATNRLVSR
jgi:proline iminopeptidase